MPRFDKSRRRWLSNRGTPREGTRPTKRTIIRCIFSSAACLLRFVGRVPSRGAFVLCCSAFLLIGLPFLVIGAKAGVRSAAKMEQRHWADFVETNFPFFSSVLDARDLGKDWPNDNLTPRGLILNLGQ